MRILVLTSSFPRYRNDWWAQFILSIYKNLDLNNFDVTVVAPHGLNAKKNEEIDGIKVRRFTYFYPNKFQILTSGEGILYAGRKKWLGKLQMFTLVMAEMLTTLNILTKNKFDIIHAHWILPQGVIAVLAKFIFRKPVVVTVHGSDIFGLKRFDFVKKFVLKYCDVCTVNSRSTFDAVRKLSPKTNIRLIPMGVDLQMFNEKKEDQNWREQFGNKSWIILGVGRLIKWKGFEYLIRAFSDVLIKFPIAKLIIIGSGPEEENLKKQARELNLKINTNLFFFGNVGHSVLSHIYATSDLLVSPSITYSKTGEKEGQGLVILEALASGLPVVASKSGGIIDIIDGKSSGLLFEEKDYIDLSKKIISVLSDEKTKKKLSENGLKLVKDKFSWEKIGQEFGRLYKEIIYE